MYLVQMKEDSKASQLDPRVERCDATSVCTFDDNAAVAAMLQGVVEGSVTVFGCAVICFVTQPKRNGCGSERPMLQ
jgi:hypothetical protein